MSDRPTKLPPLEATVAGLSKMRELILQRYAASTFNVSPHKPLQQMSEPPIEIHLEEDAQCRACHTPPHHPIYWQQQVEAELLRGEKLDVLERILLIIIIRHIPKTGFTVWWPPGNKK